MVKRILFLTSTNLASNPRLKRELQYAVGKRYVCTVLQFELGNWSDSVTTELQKEFKDVNFISISGTRTPLMPWLISSLSEKIYSLIPVFFISNNKLSVSISKRSLLILNALQKLQDHYNLVIAHNPPTFYPAMKFAARKRIPFGIDIEDYHPGELQNQHKKDRIISLMKNILPLAAYVSYSSESIRDLMSREFPFISDKSIVIINSSYGSEFKYINETSTAPLRLVWFSQYIDTGRGLESVLSVIHALNEIELHLIGNVSQPFYDEFITGKKNVIMHEPMSPQQLNTSLTKYDIGLAIEPGRDLNNQIALSNKMISYAQAGLFILSSYTTEQNRFLTTSSLGYLQTDLEAGSLLNNLRWLCENRMSIRLNRENRFRQGFLYDWERVNGGLNDVWSSFL